MILTLKIAQYNRGESVRTEADAQCMTANLDPMCTRYEGEKEYTLSAVAEVLGFREPKPPYR